MAKVCIVLEHGNKMHFVCRIGVYLLSVKCLMTMQLHLGQKEPNYSVSKNQKLCTRNNKYKFWHCFILMAHELKLHYNEIAAEHPH